MTGKNWSVILLALSAVVALILLPCFEPLPVRARPQSKESSHAAYNPYPPGILPAGLSSEAERVLREVDMLEGRALARWHALKRPVLTGQPPVFQGTGTESIETLGELMLFDRNMSPYKNEACASCHMP